jgi:hypothetical protein
MRWAAQVYAVLLVIGALVCIAWTAYEQIPVRIGVSIFLFLCAALFCWGVTRPQASPGLSGHGGSPWTAPGRKPVWLPRSWGFFVFHGTGTGLAISAWLLEGFDNYVRDLGTFHGRLCLLVLGFHSIVVGMVFLLVDALWTGTERRS